MKAGFISVGFFILILAMQTNTNAQKFKILTKSANVVDNKLVVDYSFTKFKQKHSYNVWLEIKNSAGTTLNVKSVKGKSCKKIY